MENSVISMQNVEYAYPGSEEPVLENISLNIEGGKFTVIMGKTGAGKTTLALLANGIIPQLMEGKLKGKVVSTGMDLSLYRIQTIVKNVGLVLQDPETQIFGRIVEEDIAFGPRNYLVPRKEIYERIDMALERVRLNGYQKRATSQLSGGEKQRLAIAGILAMNPSVIILDEPTSELDPLGREEIYKTIQDLQREKDMTVVAVEHSSQEISEKADEIVMLNDRKIVWQGKPSDFFRDLDLVNGNGIKPIPVSSLGWALCQKGYIEKNQIPLNMDDAFSLISSLLGSKLLANDSSAEPLHDENPLIVAKGLSFQYENGNSALSGVDLTIYKGDFVALIGQNGAGKTTLAKHFNSIHKPSSGIVRVCGKDTAKEDPSSLSAHVGYVFQNPDHQIFCTTVYKELEFGLKNKGMSADEIDARIQEVAELLGIKEVLSEHPFSLGKGERQKLAVASILALKPEILVIDEPTTGQDWAGIQGMMALIDKLHKSGTTIVMITHDMDIVARYAKRAVVLCKGKVKLDGPVREVFEHRQILSEAYVTRPQIIELSDRLRAKGLTRLAVTEEELSRLIIEALERKE